MIKTTNFEISKKLAEIGFKKETDYFFYLTKPDWYNKAWTWKYVWHYATEGWDDANNDSNFLPSYDLETLLDALHKNYLVKYDWLECFLNRDFNGTKRLENESLADTAGRMIILLYEKNLIKF